MKKYFISNLFLFAVFILFPVGHDGKNYGAFYLATDKSFDTNEIPYVNLEGTGGNRYSFRVYQVENPLAFINEKVEKRMTSEKTETAFANPASLFLNTWNTFKKDFRKIARKELNVKTRSYLKKSVQVDFKDNIKTDIAVPKLLKNHRFITSFEISENKESWFYKRIPIPVKESGFYLIEAVSNSNVAYTVVVKSNLHFITKQSDTETLIFAAQKDTGKPISDAKVNLYNANSTASLQSGMTNNKGFYHTNKNTPVESLIIVYKNGEYAISDPQFYANSFYGRKGIRSYLYTDRPVYRPGHEVNFKGIVRISSGNSYSVASGLATVDVVTENGKIAIENIPVTISSTTGSFHGKFSLPDDEDSYQGIYHLVLKYRGHSYSTEFKVESYKKPIFLVKVNSPKNTYVKNEVINATIQANYYHGAPLGGAKVLYRIFRKPRYYFSPVGTILSEELASSYLGLESSETNELFSNGQGVLGSDGNLNISFNTDSIKEDSTFNIIAYVTDSSGTTLSGSNSFSVNRGAFYLSVVRENMVYQPGDEVKMKVKLLPFDRSLTPEKKAKLLQGAEVKMTLYKREFINISAEKEKTKILNDTFISNSAGLVNINFKISEKGHYLLIFSTEDPGGEEITSETTLWASNKTDSIQVPFKDISLKPGKDLYEIGDTAEILILSPVADGYLFLTQESGKIITYDVIEMKGNSYKYPIKINNAMAPNFSVAAAIFSNGHIYKNEVKIVVPPKDKILNVKLKTEKKEYEPGNNVVLNIETTNHKENGVKSEVSISVVDESIYQIQNDKNPSLLTYFYHPRRNNIQTTLSSSYRFFGYSEERELKLAEARKKYQNFAGLKSTNEKNRENFKDTAFWNAVVQTNNQGKATVSFKLPDNLTTWRVKAVAINSKTEVGQKVINFKVRKNLMLTEHFPRYLHSGKKQNVVVNVVNSSAEKFHGKVIVQAEGATILGANTKSVEVDSMGNVPLAFDITPGETDSDNKVKITFRLTKEKTLDALTREIPVKPYGMERVISSSIKLDKGRDSRTSTIKYDKSYNNPRVKVILSAGYGEALKQSLSYLADYPYGCIEQTMSRFMPLIAAKKSGYITPYLKNKLPDMIKKGFERIKVNQNPDGGFGWFQNDQMNLSDPIMTAYVYRGLALSKKMGEYPDNAVMNRAKRYLYQFLSENGSISSLAQAYILFSLSEGEDIPDSMTNKLAQNFEKLSLYGKALTILVLKAEGREKEAEKLFILTYEESLFNKSSELIFAAYKPNSMENDMVEISATLLLAALRLDQSKKVIDNLSLQLMLNRRDIAWKNSRDTAVAVLALSELLEKYRDSAKDSTVAFEVNEEEIKTINITPEDIHSGNSTFFLDGIKLNQGDNTLTVKKTDGNPLYAITSLHYFDVSENQKPDSTGFSVSRNYYKLDSERTNQGLALSIDKTNTFNIGDQVMVEIQVSQPGGRDTYIQIDDPIPPGFSILKNDTEYYSKKFPLEYHQRQEFDDRVSFFISTNQSTFTIRYFLTADLEGKYQSLPAVTKLMYYPEERGNSTSETLVVNEAIHE